MPITAANGTVYDDNTIKSFIGQHQGDPNAIAAQAAQLGLNQDQIQQALQIGGYGGANTDPNTLASGIQSFVNAPNSGYSFGANGALTATPAQQPSAAQTPGGMYVGGQYYTPQQIKDFYAGGGNANQFLQQHGVTDLGQIHDLSTQAAGIAGTSAPTGDAALQKYFQQYQQANPNGAFANNYQGWVANQQPANLNAMKAGAFSGAPTAQADYAPGGIYGPGSSVYGTPGYGSGLGSRGQGNGWGQTTTPQQPVPTSPQSPGSSGAGVPPATTGQSGFQSSSRPMAGQISNMLNEGVQYGLGSGLQPSTTSTPLAGAQSAVSNILGTTPPATPQAATPSVGNVVTAGQGMNESTAQTTQPMGQGQATTQMQKFQSLVSSIPVGNPTPFGNNAQITRQQNGAIMVTGPSLNKPYIIDPSIPQDQMMQQLQAIYSMVNAPPSGSTQ